MKRIFVILVLISALLFGCSAKSGNISSESMGATKHDEYYELSEGFDTSTNFTNNTTSEFEENRKLIKNYTYSMQTKEFDSFIALITSKVNEAGGYVQSSSISGNSYYYSGNRNASYCIRIPSNRVSEFIDAMSNTDLAVVTNYYETVDDITSSYFDIEARIISLQKEEQSLQNLMEKATKIEDIITIESKLSDVRYEIESYQRQIKNYDLLVEYATFTMDVYEVNRVTQVEKQGMFEQIAEKFQNSIEDIQLFIQDIIIFIFGNIIYIVLLAVVVAIGYQIIKKQTKKLKNNKKTVDKTDNV